MRISAILATVVVAFGAACAGDNPAEPSDSDSYRSPVGTFTLATVNGTNVPMLWDQMDLHMGGAMLKAYWNGGSIQFRRDSTYTVVYRHSLTGPNLPGTIQEDRYDGTWRVLPGMKLELRPKSGGVQYWQTTDLIYTVTRSTTVPSLSGVDEPVVFVFVRD